MDASFVLGALPPDVQATLSQAAITYAQAAPIVSLAETVAGGRTPTEAQALGGLATAASMAGGPVAGGVVAAAGGLVQLAEQWLQSLFGALGWYGTPPPEWNYNGLLRAGIDYAPANKLDPTWWTIASVKDLDDIFAGRRGRPAISGTYNVPAVQIFRATLQQLGTPGWSSSWPRAGGQALTPFERFFLPMLRADLEIWANGVGFVPTRDLLAAAVKAWNGTHATGLGQTYSPVNYGDPGVLNSSVVSMVLGGGGDLGGPGGNVGLSQRGSPVRVNTGEYLKPAPPPRVVLKSAGNTLARMGKASAMVDALAAKGCQGAAPEVSAYQSFIGLPATGVYDAATAAATTGWISTDLTRPERPTPPPCVSATFPKLAAAMAPKRSAWPMVVLIGVAGGLTWWWRRHANQ